MKDISLYSVIKMTVKADVKMMTTEQLYFKTESMATPEPAEEGLRNLLSKPNLRVTWTICD